VLEFSVLPWYDICVDDCSGGICGFTRVEIIVEGSRVVENTVRSREFALQGVVVTGGGGIFIQDGTLRVTDSTVANNTALLTTTRYNNGKGGE
jgi:hypothetical protein